MPEIEALNTSFRQYCMGEHTFDEADYKSRLEVSAMLFYISPRLTFCRPLLKRHQTSSDSD